MSTGSSRSTPPSNRYGSEQDYNKRRKSYLPASTRRDFKSTSTTSPGSSAPAPGSSSLSQSRPPLRAEKSYYTSRPRYRELPLYSSSGSVPGSRSSSFSNDPRYSPYGKPYSYAPGYHQDRGSGAFGSYSSSKRGDSDTHSSFPGGRDVTSRDSVAGPSGLARDSWRSDRPKLNSGPSNPRLFGASRYNPNSIPVTARNSSSGLLPSTMKDRYEPNDEYFSGRHKLRMDEDGYLGSRQRSTKERIRSSGLSNSVGAPKRKDSYYYPDSVNAAPHTDRYTRDRPDRNDPSDSRRLSLTDRNGHKDLESSTARRSLRDLDVYLSESNLGEPRNPEDDEEADEDDEDLDDEEEEEEEEEEEDDIDSSKADISALEHPEIAEPTQADDEPSSAHDPTDFADTQPQIVTVDSMEVEGHIDYPDGCVFPMSKLEAEYLSLKLEYDQSFEKLSQVAAVQDFSQYSFFLYNLRRFACDFEAKKALLVKRKRSLLKKKLSLWLDYQLQWKLNEKRSEWISEQLQVIHPPDDESRKELEAIDIRNKNPEVVPESPAIDATAQAGRRGRRHGDLVTTEAEFQEILKSLKNEDDEDPVFKARRVAAVIPDMIIDPLELQTYKFMDSNNFVRDKASWERRLHSGFDTNFTEIEHDMFCDAFCRAPKRFGEISRSMGGLRTASECVMHYYISKKAVNYKYLVSQFKKKASKRSAKKKKKSKTASVSEVSNTTVSVVPNGDAIQVQIEETKRIEIPGEAIQDTMNDVLKTENGHAEAAEPPRKKAKKAKEEPKSELVLSQQDVAPSVAGFGDHQDSATVTKEPETRHEKTSEDDRKHITSYWSTVEVNAFPVLLNSYGQDWTKIAEELRSKSATMVRNYFLRNADKFGWRQNADSVGESQILASDANPPKLYPSPTSLSVSEPSHETASLKLEAPLPKTGARPPHSTESHLPADPVHFSNGGVGAAASAILNFTSSSGLLGPRSKELQKSSIMSLLNSETTPEAPQQPAAPPRRNNLASLLNAPSSPAPATPDSERREFGAAV